MHDEQPLGRSGREEGTHHDHVGQLVYHVVRLGPVAMATGMSGGGPRCVAGGALWYQQGQVEQVAGVVGGAVVDALIQVNAGIVTV